MADPWKAINKLAAMTEILVTNAEEGAGLVNEVTAAINAHVQLLEQEIAAAEKDIGGMNTFLTLRNKELEQHRGMLKDYQDALSGGSAASSEPAAAEQPAESTETAPPPGT